MTTTAFTPASPVLVVGAGIMGAGIAQVAAEAGHPVMLYDTREGAAAQAVESLKTGLDALVAKGKRSRDAVDATLTRLRPIAELDAAAGAALAVEAIVEDLAAKRALFQRLESVLGDDCVLATNTSSISVTAIANGLQRPQRLVGMHFFNPVPVMKLVEVVSGLETGPAVADAIARLATAWGKTAVHARSTPGFIVNRIARPYYAEALALLGERALAPADLDACLRGAGFRMGPCELMDLIGHDTNFAVTRSVYEANFGDKRFVPSIVQKEMVDGGLLGRKSGRGFYDHRAGAPRVPAPESTPASPRPVQSVVVHGDGPVSGWLHARLAARGVDAATSGPGDWTGLTLDGAQLRLTDGRCASEIASTSGIAEVAVFDWPAAGAGDGALAWAPAVSASADWVDQAAHWLGAMGPTPVRMADTPGLVVARTLSMLINEAADAVHQGVCEPHEADAAMKLGVNYPAGPFEWLATWSSPRVIQVLRALDDLYRGERYRVSPELRRRAWILPSGSARGAAST